MASPYELTPEQLRHTSDLSNLTFETTQEITFVREIIGQPRGIRAIEFGIDIDSPGFNIYVLGPAGSGRTTAIQQFLEKRAAAGNPPLDWVYVYNFEDEHKPRAIELPSGKGSQLRDDVANVIKVLQHEIPDALEAEEFASAVEKLDQDFAQRRAELQQAISLEATEKKFTIARTPAGLMLAPLDEKGEVITPEGFEALPEEERQALNSVHAELDEHLNEALRNLRNLDREHLDSRSKLERGAAAYVIVQHIGDLRERYEGHEEVLLYLNQIRDDVLDHLEGFKREDESAEEGPDSSSLPAGIAAGDDQFRRYYVNLIVDHSQTKGLPVILEEYPSYANLVGRIEGEVFMGALNTDFKGIKAGTLHRANGGYLVLRGRDILSQPDAWEGLKRALTSGVIRIEESSLRTGLGVIIPQTIDPEPIPLHIKVILVGTPGLYYALFSGEEDFPDLFKVKADFASTMDRTPESEMDYATFVAARCHESQWPHFNRAAVGQVIEEGSRMAGDQDKLSTLFGQIADLLQEAVFWAEKDQAEVVDAQHVQQAIAERRYRSDLYEELRLESIRREVLFIDTEGEVVGQVNGLSVTGLGDYMFGQPSRITARVYIGREGVVDIEREVELSGPIHEKGVLILRGYLGGQYAMLQQLALTGSITFEQNYSGVEGDSASAAELFVLLSALCDLPIKQGLAVTGSINQHGKIQPVGGVNEKIEGFFAVCQARGLTGSQGVIMPSSNVTDLMLRPDLVEAVRAGQFHIYAIDHVDQGLELVMGMPAGKQAPDGTFPTGTIHQRAYQRLHEMSEHLRHWMRDSGLDR